MNNAIFPCIWLNNTGAAAAEFYKTIFPATEIIGNNGIVQQLSINGQRLMFLNGGPMFQPNASISFLIADKDENEIEKLYNRLAEGGISIMPLDSYPFSKKYGWVRDKFGITWQLYTGEKGDTDQYFTPTLMFCGKNNGRAKEALQFYISVFPNSKTEGILEYPEGNQEDIAGNVQHAQFCINNFTMACLDTSINHPFNFDEGISFQVLTDNQEETDYYWNTMTKEGGMESKCGWLKDKFGVSWQIVPKRLIELLSQTDLVKAQKTAAAMMNMQKIIIADLEKAQLY